MTTMMMMIFFQWGPCHQPDFENWNRVHN